MQLSRNTSMSKSGNIKMLLIKLILIFVTLFVIVVMLNKIDFPAPNKKIEKNISNENLRIVK
tara:strand:+ start:332 stop:517 length:186 start_codon:yes stop_codon:yes gene_type:complete